MSIGLLHPGAMGASIGRALASAGHAVHWVSQHRSEATRRRAEEAGLTEVGDLAQLIERCTTLVSVCPPGEALALATQVAESGFDGCYLDANAVAPVTARSIAETMISSGASFVDGGIVGPPVKHKGLTVLYLAGASRDTDHLSALLATTALDTHYVGDAPGAASAVKMAFAAYTKGTSALLLAIRGLAEAEDVVDGLEHAWSVLTPELAERLPATAEGTAPKAWRFAGEMREIATAFESVGLPPGFHHAAAEIYEALADLRDREGVSVDEVVRRLVRD